VHCLGLWSAPEGLGSTTYKAEGAAQTFRVHLLWVARQISALGQWRPAVPGWVLDHMADEMDNRAY